MDRRSIIICAMIALAVVLVAKAATWTVGAAKDAVVGSLRLEFSELDVPPVIENYSKEKRYVR